MSENIFEQPNESTPAAAAPNPPTVPDNLRELIGEGKKYASVEKALEALPHAQSHIQRIEEENRAMRDKLAEANAAEEVYKKLMESLKPDSPATPAAAQVDEASIASILERKLAERETMQKHVANVTRVKDALVGKYGDKAQEIYEAKAKELGVGVGFLNDIVKHSPRAAEELFGIKAKEIPAASSTPGINTLALPATNRPGEPGSAKVGGTSSEDLLKAWRAAKPAQE